MVEVPQLGLRGGGWVVFQFALIAAIVIVGVIATPWPDSIGSAFRVFGLVAAVAGGAVAVFAARTLGRSLTPFPKPLERAEVVERGPYRVVRHPIYSGGILFFGGFSLAFSPWALLLTGVLAVTWGLKAKLEERFLRERFAGYAEYCSRTRYRICPYLY